MKTKMTPISYHPRQAFFYYLIQFTILFIGLAIFFHFYDKTPWKFVLASFPLAILISAILTFLPYAGAFRKISTLYKDKENNLYVDKLLVDKKLIESIRVERLGWSPKKNEYFVMNFTDLPAEVKSKNFNKTAIVYSEIKIIYDWPNLVSRTEKNLYDMGIRLKTKYTE